MGKKILSQEQVKISKRSNEKKQLNSLIKVLRPKVYITESSSFKKLVQQLTGNETSASAPSSLPQMVDKAVPVVDVGFSDHGNPESSMESSFDGSLESFQVCCNHSAWSSEEINQAASHPMHTDAEMISQHCLFMNASLAYGDVQPLLQLDGDSFNVYSQIQQELSVYDYELSGLI